MLSFHIKFVQTDRRKDRLTDGRTDRPTDNGKTIYPPILRYGGIKILDQIPGLSPFPIMFLKAFKAIEKEDYEHMG